MSQTYQLSKSGIERLERFKRDLLAGDFEIAEGSHYLDGGVSYYVVSNSDSSICCFDCSYNQVPSLTLEGVKNTIECKIEKRYMSHDGSPYFCVVGGVAINRIDITTPAQRALEALANKLNGDTK